MLFLKKELKQRANVFLARHPYFHLITPLAVEPERNKKVIVLFSDMNGELDLAICVYDCDNGHGRFVRVDDSKRISDCIAWTDHVEGGEKE